MKKVILPLIFILGLISQAAIPQICNPYTPDSSWFDVNPRYVRVEADFYQSWLEYMDGLHDYPADLEPSYKWMHPWMRPGLPNSMHEDPFASDVSNLQGPNLENPRVQYFQVREKGEQFSGMCPSFAFLDENTMVTLSFGRDKTTLLLLDITDSVCIIDAMEVPGRGNKAMELISKKKRMSLFRDTSGGAYFFLTERNEVVIPGPEYTILWVPIENNRFVMDKVIELDILEQIEKADLVHEGLDEEEGWNKLTAVMPDAEGNIWFTSRLGLVGVIDLKGYEYEEGDEERGCPRVYSTFILKFGLLTKIKTFFGEKYADLTDLEFYREGMTETEYRNELRQYFMVEPDSREEIQNSFSIGPDGVYIVSNIALYKLRFNEETNEIEMDPKWEETFKKEKLIYPNEWKMKMGQLNNGSGTTPTLVDDRFVVIGDNDYHQINMCVYRQDDGELVGRYKVFEYDSSACENSVVAYGNTLIMGNTFNFIDPFKENTTPGGLVRFDFNESKGQYEKREDWPAEFIDPKSATPKMTTNPGLIYVYNREETAGEDEYFNWQLTAIDFETGRKVFYIRPYLEKGEFDDNVGWLIKSFSLGTKDYDNKVFNNIWATYTFGPNNSIYIGAFRGFLKFSSDPFERRTIH